MRTRAARAARPSPCWTGQAYAWKGAASGSRLTPTTQRDFAPDDDALNGSRRASVGQRRAERLTAGLGRATTR
jgi:hypothetical protein